MGKEVWLGGSAGCLPAVYAVSHLAIVPRLQSSFTRILVSLSVAGLLLETLCIEESSWLGESHCKWYAKGEGVSIGQ